MKECSASFIICEMQCKTTMICYYIPIWKAYIKKWQQDQAMVNNDVNNWVSYKQPLWKWYSHSGKEFSTFYKVKHALDPAVPFLGIWKISENICSHKNLDMIIDSNIINNHKKLEATQRFANVWKDKQTIVHPCNGFSLIK